jgi:hypothetical protein
MEKHRVTFKVKSMCRVLGASRSGYYAWRTGRPSVRQQHNEELLEHIWDAHKTSRSLYWSPRITAELNEQGMRIIGLSMSDQLSQNLTAAALTQSVSRQKPPQGLIHHSDRGRQYASYAYQDLLKRYGLRASMSRSGNCYDNAFMESFFGTLKTEWVYERRYRTKQEARLSIFEYVEVFYNRTRRHSALGYRSPEQYEGLLCET